MPDLEGFFSSDPERALAAVVAIAGASAGGVTSTGTMFRVDGQLQVDPDGIWSPDRFGVEPNERWAHVPVHGVVHRALLVALVSDDADLAEFVVPLAQGEAALADGALVLRPPEDGELTGWAAFEAIVGEDSPLLPLCRIRAVPVPPRSRRPLHERLSPTQLDPWIGPLNERWVDLVAQARREEQLVGLGASSSLLRVEADRTQHAFDAVFAATAGHALLPPLWKTREGLAPPRLCFATDELLLLQRGREVRGLDLLGGTRFVLPPAACALAGMLDERHALFETLFPLLVPGLGDPEIRLSRDFEGVEEQSVVDVAEGRYLERTPPTRLPRHELVGDQPEDLFVGTDRIRRLHVGGDRPEVMARTRDLRFSWCGEFFDSVIVDEHAVAQFRPSRRRDLGREHGADRWALTAAADAADPEDGDESGFDWCQEAVAFAEGRWWMVYEDGLLSDGVGAGWFLVPRPGAAAFDRSGRRLALVLRDEIVVVDPVGRTVSARLPLPRETGPDGLTVLLRPR